MGTRLVALYCRVDRGGSQEMRQMALASQQQQLTRYAKRKGLKVAACYTDDGFPGSNMERPGLTKLMKDYDEGVFEEVLVVDRGRLYRGSPWNEPRWPFQIRSLNQLEMNRVR